MVGDMERSLTDEPISLSRRQLLTAAAVGPLTAATLGAADSPPVDPWTQVRRQFPVEDGLVYFNTGTYGPSPRAFAAAECHGRDALNHNFNRYFYDHFIDQRFVGLINRVAGFIGAGRNDIAFTSGATEGMSYIAGGLDLQTGDEVLTTTHEHQAGVYPWLLAAKRRGITVRQIPLPTPITADDEVQPAGPNPAADVPTMEHQYAVSILEDTHQTVDEPAGVGRQQHDATHGRRPDPRLRRKPPSHQQRRLHAPTIEDHDPWNVGVRTEHHSSRRAVVGPRRHRRATRFCVPCHR